MISGQNTTCHAGEGGRQLICIVVIISFFTEAFYFQQIADVTLLIGVFIFMIIFSNSF